MAYSQRYDQGVVLFVNVGNEVVKRGYADANMVKFRDSHVTVMNKTDNRHENDETLALVDRDKFVMTEDMKYYDLSDI